MIQPKDCIKRSTTSGCDFPNCECNEFESENINHIQYVLDRLNHVFTEQSKNIKIRTGDPLTKESLSILDAIDTIEKYCLPKKGIFIPPPPYRI